MHSIRLLFTNNYDMARAREGWRSGLYPAHHLYGTANLGRSFNVVDVQFRDDDLLARGTRRLHGRLGDLGLQLRSGVRLRRRSIVYGAQAQDLALLAALRRSGALRVPIVGVFHGVRLPTPVGRAALLGFDHAVALSKTTRATLIESGMPSERISVVNWGPDLEFPGFAGAAPASSDAPIVATGKTGRDMNTLIEALRRTDAPARIFANREMLASGSRIPPRVEIVRAVPASTTAGGPFTYAHTLRDLQSAAAVAIPLMDPYPLHGLTELADAMACGRPVILTRAPYFDVDVEAIGCGWWVDQGDVDGWAKAVTEALSDRGRLAEMGEAGRRWASEHWNARLFADRIRQVLLNVAADSSSGA